MKRIISIILVLALMLAGCFLLVHAEEAKKPASLVDARGAILVEASSGKVLYESNPNEKLPIASVTKTMTMLLIMEAIDSGKIKMDDMVTVSENAASMGGSQVYLAPGETMTVHDMLKAIAVASGNDASVAMAEHIAGSEEAFVQMMNKRAEEVGAVNSHFDNASGLEEENNYSTAYDIAMISRELLKHPTIHEFLTIWMDSLRNGEFTLSNTNRMIRFYQGANGIKTGSTSTAKYCLSASAKRDNMQLIAVVLGAPTTAERFGSATKLLDYGFANYAVVDESILTEPFNDISVTGGVSDRAAVGIESGFGFVVDKGQQSKVEKTVNISAEVKAPVAENDKIGEIIFSIDGNEVHRANVVAKEGVGRIKLSMMYARMLRIWLKV